MNNSTPEIMQGMQQASLIAQEHKKPYQKPLKTNGAFIIFRDDAVIRAGVSTDCHGRIDALLPKEEEATGYAIISRTELEADGYNLENFVANLIIYHQPINHDRLPPGQTAYLTARNVSDVYGKDKWWLNRKVQEGAVAIVHLHSATYYSHKDVRRSLEAEITR